jgi:pimeloyl-ACP methyl ester carboxylesterase
VNTVEYLRAASACRARWVGRGVDLCSYSARERADDVRDLAIALSFPEIDFVAGGLGTVDARELAGRYPQLVHSITLINVTPPQTTPWNGAITNAAGALDRFFGECTNDRSCNERYPSLRRTFIATYARLQSAPAAYTITSPTGDGRKVRVLLDGDRVAQILLFALDTPDAPALVPVALNDSESAQAVADFGARTLVFPAEASWGALFSRTCIDDAPSVGQDGLKVEAESEPQLAFVADDPLLDVCTVWSAKPPVARAPAPASTPTLVLQGDLDPFTSRAWADQAARAFVRASIVLLPHFGKVDSVAARCVTEMRQQFLAEPTRRIAAEPCVRSIPPIRFAGT